MVTPLAGQLEAYRQKAVHYSGHVLDETSKQPVNAASIQIIPPINAGVWRTNAKGEFTFWVPWESEQRIEVGAPGYQTVVLQWKAGSQQEVLVRATSASDPRRSNATSEYVAPSQSVLPAIMTADSGPKPSGKGLSWSAWYRLGVGKAPKGYSVRKAEFWLSGDRACGAWAECREIVSNDQQVLWEFRLQGHTEFGAPEMTFSVGHIKVTYGIP